MTMADNEITRRDFVTITVGAGIAASSGATPAAQQKMVETDVNIKTADGTCDAAFIHPPSGSHPGIVIWPDAFGLRPSMREIGTRLAAEGYSVLVPNPFLSGWQGAALRGCVELQFRRSRAAGEIDAADGVDQRRGRRRAGRGGFHRLAGHAA
jgi:hypothetical protein